MMFPPSLKTKFIPSSNMANDAVHYPHTFPPSQRHKVRESRRPWRNREV